MGSFAKKIKKAVRKVYDATSDSRSSFGKVGKWFYPYNGQYFVRDGWRSLRKKMIGKSSAVSVSAGLPSASYVPGTGFRRYV